jgi:hypothetical protein
MSNTPGRSSYFCFSMDLPDDEAAQKVAQQFAGQLGWNAGSGNATVVVLDEDKNQVWTVKVTACRNEPIN